jgi:glycosyltransferase involved in cell wall biosynthesis
VGEASYLATGFSTYWAEVIKRIHATGEFEIAELGSYAHDGDPRNEMVPWRFYPVVPHPSDRAATQVYNSRPTNQFGEWRFTDVLLDFKPDIAADIRDHWMCLSIGSPVHSRGGTIKNIEDIVPGDHVRSHTGRECRVVRTFTRPYSGSLHTIKASLVPFAVSMTDGHPILVHRRAKRNSLNPRWDNDAVRWVKAEEVTRQDFVCYPIPSERQDDPAYTHGRCRLLGYYAAQGCLMYEGRRSKGKLKGIQLVFGTHKRRFIEDAASLIEAEFKLKPTIRRPSGRNILVLRVFNRAIAEFFHNAVGEHAHHKRFCPELFVLPDDKIANLLSGLFRGDGCLRKRASYCTVSKQLAHQTFALCTRLGIVPCCSYNNNRIRGKSQVYKRYIFEFAAASKIAYAYLYNNAGVPPHPDRTRSTDRYVFLTIKKLCRRVVSDTPVYNLEAEHDNSYVSAFAVHNCEFEERSPLRNNFTLIQMPTVDGSPQRDQWLDTYSRLDHVLTYSEWGKRILENESGGKIKVTAVASPGADVETFKPVADKAAHKAKLGIDPHCYIVGSTARNQPRKLHFDLIEAFAQWLSKTKSGMTDLANRTYLYLHTSYPDVGYDIGKAVREFKIGKKVLMTYLCPSCGVAYPSFFAGEWTNCRACGKPGAHPPNANHGVSRETLASIMNLFDLYVQYSICEGWAMPCTEAKSLGVPVMAVNYSAMEDHCNTPGGIPINVQRFFYEPVIETEQRRALPDNEHFGQQLTRFLRMKPEQRAELSRRTREYIVEPAEVWGQTEKLPRFSYDRTAAIWANLLRTCKIKDPAETWLAPSPSLYQPNLKVPRPDMNNTEFVRWAITSVLGRPELARSFWAGEWIKALNCGFRIETGQKVPVNHDTFVQYLLALVQERNSAELSRVASLRSSNLDQLPIEVF